MEAGALGREDMGRFALMMLRTTVRCRELDAMFNLVLSSERDREATLVRRIDEWKFYRSRPAI